MTDPTTQRPAWRRWLAAAASLVLIVVVGVAAAADLPAVNFADPGYDPPTRPPAANRTAGRINEFDLSDAKEQDKAQSGHLAELWDVAKWVLLAIGVVIVAAIMVRRLLNRARDLDAPELDMVAVPELKPEDADTAFASAQQELHATSDVREAIIRVWLTLEQLVSTSGIERKPHETTGEYVVAVLGRLHPDESRLRRLAELYRRALFDDRRPDETDRQDAFDLLANLRDQLAVTRG